METKVYLFLLFAYTHKKKDVLLCQLLGFSIPENEKGKRCDAFAVPATVSATLRNSLSHCALRRMGRQLRSTSQETCLRDSSCYCSG